MKEAEVMTVSPLRLRYDTSIAISIGKSRYDRKWKNSEKTWSWLVCRVSQSLKTAETHQEFLSFPKDKQDNIKDIGGFVGGYLKEGKRRAGNVTCRQVITLDIDFPEKDFWDRVYNNFDLDFAMCVYSTHKHTEQKPRLRLLIPLNRTVSPDEYEAIARKMAEKIGIDYFDDSTFQPTRLMYWPSHSCDVQPFFRYIDRPVLIADDVLAEYPDWMDTSYWPESSRMSGIRKRQADKQGDPTKKMGIVGAFCRTYTVQDAIRVFLDGVYTEAINGRYTYTLGSSSSGLVLYENGTFAYSNHATDPAGGLLCNAFDLVRIHMFGDRDEEAQSGGNITSRASYKAMSEFASQDENVIATIAKDKREAALLDFSDEDGTDTTGEEKANKKPREGWEKKLKVTENGEIKPTITNCILILDNDESLKSICYNELTGSIEVLGALPWNRPNRFWRDADEAQIYGYVADSYGVQFPENRFSKALSIVVDKRRFNPLADFIKGLPEWDGVERVDRLLIDFLGAEDCDYVKAVTRKTLVGAIKRVRHPGCKFDTVLVLDGKPGIGKSTLLRKLGGEFFSDSLSLADTRDKTAAEKLQGVWIAEIGEMQGTRKADVDVMKGFISRQVDEYRAAYGRVVEKRPRTAIIFGTTNSTTGFLRDTTGNRRFWPVNVSGGSLSVWGMTDDYRLQIWAEAKHLESNGETTYLDLAMEKEAEAHQREALEYDDREGEVVAYLDTLLPEDWYEWDLARRVDYFQQPDALAPDRPDGTMKRDRVCAREIFVECWGKPKNSWRKQDGYEIAAIMARITEWENTGRQAKLLHYGHQRVYTRKRTDFSF